MDWFYTLPSRVSQRGPGVRQSGLPVGNTSLLSALRSDLCRNSSSAEPYNSPHGCLCRFIQNFSTIGKSPESAFNRQERSEHYEEPTLKNVFAARYILPPLCTINRSQLKILKCSQSGEAAKQGLPVEGERGSNWYERSRQLVQIRPSENFPCSCTDGNQHGE